jgi:ubiquinone/menaquinone biosynthesis C-methylase UbiE
MARDHSQTNHRTGDRLIHWAWLYDLGVRFLGRRGRRLRAIFAEALKLRPGDRVLDVGCGTGHLAMVFAERVAPTGSVDGVEMVARANRQARRHRAPVTFQIALAQQLPFPDVTFDAVACTLALHHVC